MTPRTIIHDTKYSFYTSDLGTTCVCTSVIEAMMIMNMFTSSLHVFQVFWWGVADPGTGQELNCLFIVVSWSHSEVSKGDVESKFHSIKVHSLFSFCGAMQFYLFLLFYPDEGGSDMTSLHRTEVT